MSQPGSDSLLTRLSSEFESAKQRVQAMQAEASSRHREIQDRHKLFLQAAERVGRLFKPRIETFTQFFKGFEQKVDLVRTGKDLSSFQGAVASFSFPHTAQCPAQMKLTFRLEHDQDVRNLILGYALDIVPIFIEFEKQDRLVVPIEALDESVVASWIDEKLVAFTRTYLKLFFTPQYQQDGLVPDLVLGISFPRVFAAGSAEHAGRTYFFFTPESLASFRADPDHYAGPPRAGNA